MMINVKFHIGKRIWKTAFAVLICFLIYMLRSEQAFPFFSTITAILCMQPYVGNIGKIAANQLLGTMIGAIYGVIVVLLFQYLFPATPLIVMIIVISAFIIPVIKTAVLIGRAEMAHFVCVVFLCMALYLFDEGDPFLYVLDRVMDTIIGIVVALAVNSFNIPRRRHKELLFVSAFDDTLMQENNRLSGYSKVELNRMIADGANFTISTEQTPASLMEFFAGLNFNLPVIAMNGAVLYDISRNKYIHKIPLGRDIIDGIRNLLDAEGAGCFYNTLIQDTLLIYFADFKNMAMQELYRDLRKNPYRNYVYGQLPDNVKILYLYIIDDSAKITRLIKALKESTVSDKIRLVTGREEKYSGQSYLKIYSYDATRQNMIAYLRQIINAKAAVTFGNEEAKYDFMIDDGNEDRVVRIMKAIYRPFIWEKSYEKKMQRINERLRNSRSKRGVRHETE